MSTPAPTPQQYPLQWPPGWPATPVRESGRFKTKLSSALTELRREVALLGGKNLVLSSNVTLDNQSPAQPGVCAYFILREQNIAIPCDRWRTVADNVHAIALTVGAIRGMDRWGAKHMITAMFAGFTALPASSGSAWNEVLGVSPTATEKQIMAAYYVLAQERHPDKAGGSHDAFAALCQAKDLGLSSLKHR